MSPEEPIILEALQLDHFHAESLVQIREAFAGAPSITMRQYWLRELETGFMPATIRTGWRDDTLLLFAEMVDVDIFNGATSLNECTWLLGDVFEVFLQAEDQAGYVEFHVTPENNRLQKAFPESGAEAILIPNRAFHSKTWVDQKAQLWSVYMEIPSASVSGRQESLLDCQWRFSFSRYDYTRGQNEPIISSTSAHLQPSFHRVAEWSSLLFKR
jgi:hypothetical protein